VTCLALTRIGNHRAIEAIRADQKTTFARILSECHLIGNLLDMLRVADPRSRSAPL